MVLPYQDLATQNNLSTEDWATLWCHCSGNSTVLQVGSELEDKLQPLHSAAWIQGVLYVCVILAFYVGGLLFIALRSGSDCNSIGMMLYSCCAPTASCCRGSNRNRLNVRRQKSSLRSTNESWYDTYASVPETDNNDQTNK